MRLYLKGSGTDDGTSEEFDELLQQWRQYKTPRSPEERDDRPPEAKKQRLEVEDAKTPKREEGNGLSATSRRLFQSPGPSS